MKEAIRDIKMNPHRPKKPASDESTTDEEEMIVYDVEDEIESNPDYVKENASTVKNYEGLDEEICDCQNFVSIPRDMLGRSKNMDNAILYESVFEKPDMWRIDGVPFSKSSGLGKDVYGIVQRYLKKT
ncbi:hypothetical protein TNCV_4570191 [Trichonephila clavipes]|nr:hypothetical protein TNCV_4570191 [Trichonephila clavipes]